MPLIPLSAGQYDPEQRVIRGPTGRVDLTPIEGRLLDFFLAQAGRTLTHEELLQEVWGYAPGVRSRTLYATVDRLRKKIEADPSAPRHLHNRARVGYRFELGQSIGSEDLVGREAELGALLGALGPGRLLTLTGAGGAGKTRLARELQAEAHKRGWEGLFCELASARDEGALVAAVAGTLDIPLDNEDPVAQIGRALDRAGRILLILDNLEQLIAAVVPAVERWRVQAPQACLVLTSRIPLRIAKEVLHAVPPLAVPDPGEDPASIARAPAVLLLQRRAAEARAGPGGDADLPALARIARAVEGLPLAIELAAARLRLLPPATLAERLEADLGLLRDPDRPTRHGTMAAVVAWSWGLLPPRERDVLHQCAVFTAPFDAAFAEAVVEGPEPAELLDSLGALVDHHLLRPAAGGALRFELSEPVRAFLASLGDLPAELPGRHARACAARAGDRDALDSAEAVGAWLQLRADLPHLLHAARAAATVVPEAAARAALLAWQVLEQQGPLSAALEALDRFDGNQALPDDLRFALDLARVKALRLSARLAEAGRRLEGLCPRTAAERAALALQRGLLARQVGDLAAATTVLAAGASEADAAGDPLLAAEIRAELGAVFTIQGEGAAARAALEEALLHLPAGSGLRTRLVAEAYLCRLLILQGQLERALALQGSLLGTCRALGLRRKLPAALDMLGYIRCTLGDLEGAREALSQALAEVERHGLLSETWILRRGLGWVELSAGRLEAARDHLRRAARGAGEAGDTAREALALWRLAEVERRAGDPKAALLFLRRAEAGWTPGRFPVEWARAIVVRGRASLALGDRPTAEGNLEEAQKLLFRQPPGWEPELESEIASLRNALDL